MYLIKTLICMRGYDNGRRFLAINISCYLLFLLLSPVLAKAGILMVLMLLVCTPLLLAAGLRRIHDAGFERPLLARLLALLPAAVFWLSAFVVTYSHHWASYLLLVVALLVTLAMATISYAGISHAGAGHASTSHLRSKRNPQLYVMGYSGPVEETTKSQTVSEGHQQYSRVEPTIASAEQKATAGIAVESHSTGLSSADSSSADLELTQQKNEELPDEDSQIVDSNLVARRESSTENREPHRVNQPRHAGTLTGQRWEKQLIDWVNRYRQQVLMGVGLLIAVLMLSIGLLLSNTEEEKGEIVSKPPVATKQRLNKLEMSDNYWLMFDQHQGLTIAWPGDFRDNGEIWSAITGQGDKDCFEIVFDNNNKLRTMKVSIVNDGDYYADFSPIDTRQLIKAIALKSRFDLCGYNFSLKGTQAKLHQNQHYEKYLE